MLLLWCQDQLLFCDDCDRGYHMYCLSPPLSEPPEGKSFTSVGLVFFIVLLYMVYFGVDIIIALLWFGYYCFFVSVSEF